MVQSLPIKVDYELQLDLIRVSNFKYNGLISFSQFKDLIVSSRKISKTQTKESIDDTKDAFVALGGQSNLDGYVDSERLIRITKEFQMTIDIESLIKEQDKDGSGKLEFEEFKELLN